MRLSDAILLGAMILRPKCGIFENANGEGCALGMANKALGGQGFAPGDFRLEQAWPWISHTPVSKLPCNCSVNALLIGACGCHTTASDVKSCIWMTIVHLFNQHVCDGSWTIERLADWVRSVEPAEDVPSSDGALAARVAHAEVGEKGLVEIAHGPKT